MVQTHITDKPKKLQRKYRGPYGKADEMFQTDGRPKKPNHVGKTETWG